MPNIIYSQLETIESMQNKNVKLIASLKNKKFRDLEQKFVLEGEKFINNISLDWDIDFFAIAASQINNFDLGTLAKRAKVISIKDSIYDAITDTINPQGILAVCKIKKHSIENVFAKKNSFFVILEQCSDAGNLGTILRTADAANVDGVFICTNSTDIYNPKVLRSSAGSIFNVAFYTDLSIDYILDKCKENKITTIATHLKGTKTPYELDLSHSVALIIGNESRGISDNSVDLADELVKLPIIGKAESLNASVACGIMIYEVVRQRLEARQCK